MKLPLPVKLNDRLSVAPRRGAWIETGRTYETAKKVWVAPRRGAWIETKGGDTIELVVCGRTPQGCVD